MLVGVPSLTTRQEPVFRPVFKDFKKPLKFAKKTLKRIVPLGADDVLRA